ncbi:hypothetical protein P0D88_47440 [Paraburkholderia sp. RL18-103-BIB-C]|uniref:hypothetical protein n=1 Tax=unclassified Paraburkholderia TaxID=2615204 RepID=UPI0038B96444
MGKQYLTVVIELPDDQEQRNAVKKALPLFEDFHGGWVTAMYLGDAITENELFEKEAKAKVTARVRRTAAGL